MKKKCRRLLSPVFKKSIIEATTSTFQEVVGVAQPLMFCRRRIVFSWYRVNHYTTDIFLLSRYSYGFVR